MRWWVSSGRTVHNHNGTILSITLVWWILLLPSTRFTGFTISRAANQEKRVGMRWKLQHCQSMLFNWNRALPLVRMKQPISASWHAKIEAVWYKINQQISFIEVRLHSKLCLQKLNRINLLISVFDSLNSLLKLFAWTWTLCKWCQILNIYDRIKEVNGAIRYIRNDFF